MQSATTLPEVPSDQMIAAGGDLLAAFLDCRTQAARRWAKEVWDAMVRKHQGTAYNPTTGRTYDWSAQLIEDLFCEAADTLRRLPPDRRDRPAKLRSAHPDVVRSYAEAGTGEAPDLGRPAPDRLAVERLSFVLDWSLWLPEDARPVIWCRAFGVPWAQIARRDGRAERTLRYRHAACIDNIVGRLNSSVTRRHPFTGIMGPSRARAATRYVSVR